MTKDGPFLYSFIYDFMSFYTNPFILGTIALWVIIPCASFLLITAIAVVCIYFVTLSVSVFEAQIVISILHIIFLRILNSIIHSQLLSILVKNDNIHSLNKSGHVLVSVDLA